MDEQQRAQYLKDNDFIPCITDRTHRLAAAALGIEASEHAGGWTPDEEAVPGLWMLYGSHVSKLAVPDFMWALGRPANVLKAFAQAHEEFSEELAITAPANLYGVAFSSEGWAASATTDDPTAVKDLEERAHRREIHHHPDRMEVRMATAVDLAGDVVTVIRPRSWYHGRLPNVPFLDESTAGDVPHMLLRIGKGLAAVRATAN